VADDDLASQFAADLAEAAAAGEFDAALNEFMAGVVEVWQGNSPQDSGDYKDSVEVIAQAGAGKGRVGASVGYANLVEFGSVNNPEYAPRRRTIEHFTTGSP
jgi:hypothetical protein